MLGDFATQRQGTSLSGDRWLTFDRATLFIVGIVAFSPVTLPVAGTQLYVAQMSLGGIIIALYLARSRTMRSRLGSLDRLVIAYLFWVVLSFTLTVAVTIAGDPSLVEAQLASMVTTLALMSAFVVGRTVFLRPMSVAPLIAGLAIGSVLFILAAMFLYLSDPAGLFSARQVLRQRFPLIAVVVAAIFLVLGFGPMGRKNWVYLSIGAGASLVVVLSLTRAAWLAWLVAGATYLAILAFSRKRGRREWLRRDWIVVVAAIVAVGFVSVSAFALSQESSRVIRDVQSRLASVSGIEPMMVIDVSTVVRIEIWQHAIEQFARSPERLIVGYGQLGPGRVGVDFVSRTGVEITSMSAHSQALDAVYRSGVPGAALQLAITLYAFHLLIGLSRRSEDGLFFLGCAVSIPGMLAYGIFHETLRWQVYGFFFWFLVGVVAALSAASGRDALIVSECHGRTSVLSDDGAMRQADSRTGP